MRKNLNELECECEATIFNVFKSRDCIGCRFNVEESVQKTNKCTLGYAEGLGCIRLICAVCGEVKEHITYTKEC